MLSSKRQGGFVSIGTLEKLLEFVPYIMVGLFVFLGFLELRSLYIEKGKNEVASQYRESLTKANDELRDLKAQLEHQSRTEADAVDKAVKEALSERNRELEEYRKSVEAYRSQNASLLSQLKKHSTDKPVVTTEPGSISDIAVNSINRMIDSTNRSRSGGGK